VVESGKTRTRAVIDSLNRLEAVGARVLGVALTKATGSGGYGYGYGHGYGYGKDARLERTEILMIPKSPRADAEDRSA
jgi:Mrp family chromosome partitioning ATPase